MVRIGVMGLGEVKGSEINVIEVRAVSGQEGYWIDWVIGKEEREMGEE